jgi:hypothetical protein
MWVFTEWADAFDKVKRDNEKALDGWLTDWASVTLDDNRPWYRNAITYAGIGGVYSVNKLSTEVLAGFIDVLRIGDGVSEGGWGYGKDALRLLVIAGPALRVFRFGAALLSVDIGGNRCAWIAGTQALRLTGTRHFARVGDLAKAVGVAVEDTGPANLDRMLTVLQSPGIAADAKMVGGISSFEDIAQLAQKNPNSVIMFGVQWQRPSGTIGHALLATRGPGGIIRIIDRSGRVVSSLAELEPAPGLGGYSGIGGARFVGKAITINNSMTVDLLNNAPSILNLIALELRSAPVPPPLLDGGGRGNSVVLKSNPQLATGWWMVQAGQFTAVYLLAPGGKARWRDPWNHKWGAGTWKLGPTSLEIEWTATGTKESWLLKDMGSGLQDFGIPALRVTGQMEGTCVMKGYGTLPVKALKINTEDVQTVVGTWRVSVHDWVWDYTFDSVGNVKGVDPNTKETSFGTWDFAARCIYISWAPKSGTREEWDWPMNLYGQTGKFNASYGRYDVNAKKTS